MVVQNKRYKTGTRTSNVPRNTIISLINLELEGD